MCQPVSEPNEAAVCTSVAEGLRAALAAYAGPIGDDLALLRSGKLAPGSRAERAVQVRGEGRGGARRAPLAGAGRGAGGDGWVERLSSGRKAHAGGGLLSSLACLYCGRGSCSVFLAQGVWPS
jgi:hypothetical protein